MGPQGNEIREKKDKARDCLKNYVIPQVRAFTEVTK